MRESGGDGFRPDTRPVGGRNATKHGGMVNRWLEPPLRRPSVSRPDPAEGRRAPPAPGPRLDPCLVRQESADHGGSRPGSNAHHAARAPVRFLPGVIPGWHASDRAPGSERWWDPPRTTQAAPRAVPVVHRVYVRVLAPAEHDATDAPRPGAVDRQRCRQDLEWRSDQPSVAKDRAKKCQCERLERNAVTRSQISASIGHLFHALGLNDILKSNAWQI
jgi:hypothetical protein